MPGRKPRRQLEDVPEERMDHGLWRRPTCCPKCEATENNLAHEPALTRCFNCGTLWPIRGGNLAAQREYEGAMPRWRTG